jgi:hypothetical protein
MNILIALGVYLICGVVFHMRVVTKYTRIKTKLPMWLAHTNIVVFWLPLILISLMNRESELEQTLNTSIKDSGLIQPIPGIEMPGKDY